MTQTPDPTPGAPQPQPQPHSQPPATSATPDYSEPPTTPPTYAAPPAYSAPTPAPPPYAAPPAAPPPYSAPPAPSAPPGYPGGFPQQVSSVPVSAYPGSAQPVSAYPVSAYPVSAYPTTGYPYPVPPPRVPTRKGPWLWVLAAVCAVMVVAIGVLGYLTVADNAARADKTAAQDSQIADLTADVRDEERRNEGVQGEIDGYQQDLTEEQDLLADLEQCPAAVQAYIDTAQAADDDSDPAYQAAVEHMIDVCHLF